MGFRLSLKNGWLSPIHYSKESGVHADFNPYDGGKKLHIPYEGQCTLDMFGIGSKPSYETYNIISRFGLGTLKPDKAF